MAARAALAAVAQAWNVQRLVLDALELLVVLAPLLGPEVSLGAPVLVLDAAQQEQE